MGMAPRGHEWTVEGTRAGPRDARRLDVGSEGGKRLKVKSEKKGENVTFEGFSLNGGYGR